MNEILNSSDFKFYFLIITFGGLFIFIFLRRIILKWMGQNISLSEEKLYSLAEEYIQSKTPEYKELYGSIDESSIEILIECTRIEIKTYKIKNIKELQKYLNGKFQNELNKVLNAKV